MSELRTATSVLLSIVFIRIWRVGSQWFPSKPCPSESPLGGNKADAEVLFADGGVIFNVFLSTFFHEFVSSGLGIKKRPKSTLVDICHVF